ncbi:TIGR03750 family conjugal transfer protein [Vibrio fluvialis]|uniref:TIGR03750 family conjugal transfer protein n=1 Tax=Vibrio fluvialis TaxID=676 RepID=UPI00192B5E81|nr:TIGR03750 family conjugal transfer protein [Vibrio fluvialis]MBL4262823.1 TIGR03750 family conjugal transfer protein [Vibrio fluvialis]
MKEESDFTDQHVCDAVNEEPLALGGMTEREMKLFGIIFFAVGTVLGLIIGYLINVLAIFLIIGILFPLVGLVMLSKVFARLRRGKPPGWLYQKIAILLKKYIGKEPSFLRETGIWTLGRQK